MATFDYIKWELETSADTWADITADVVGEHNWSRCNLSNNLTDRVAKLGRLNFKLNNSDTNSGGLAGYYSPGHTNCRSGFGTGKRVRLTYCYDGLDFCKFIGTIYKKGISPMAGVYGPRQTAVTVTDIVAKFENSLDLPTLASNKTAAEVVALVMTNLGITPDATSYGTMTMTFPAVFDTARKKSAGSQEITKAIISEWGYFLTQMDRANGETIVVQGRADRDAAGYLQTPTATDESDRLLLTNGKNLITTGGKKLALRRKRNASLTVQTGLVVADGASIMNHLRITVNPRSEDAAATSVLCQIEDPILLDQAGGPKESTTVRLPYKDPDQLAQTVTTKEMQTPVATTDYTANTQSDGGGSDQTAKLVVVADYGANEAEFTITNTHTADVYVTKLQGRGKGIYIYSPVDKVIKDDTSINTYEPQELAISFAYLTEREAEELADQIIAIEKDPILNVLSGTYKANRSSAHMMLFLYGEPGHKIAAAETQTGVDRDVFIQGISVQSEASGRVVNVTYPFIEASRCSYT